MEWVQLERSLPFVDAVFRIVEKRGTAREAARILLAAQRRHGLSIVRCSLPSDYVEACVAGLIAGSADLSTPSKDRPPDDMGEELCALYVKPRPIQQPPGLVGPLDPPIERSLLGFLDQTGLIVTAENFLDEYRIFFWGAGAHWSCTWRAWGEIVAMWANRLEWMTPDPNIHTWKHLDFYMDLFQLNTIIEDWNRWYAAEQMALEEACYRWPGA